MPGPQGTTPIFVNVPVIYSSNVLITQNQTKDMTSGTIPNPVFKSNTSTGSYLDHIRAKPTGTNIASAARIFLNNGGVTTGLRADGGANNMLLTEISLPAITISEVAAQIDIVIPIKIALPPAWNVYTVLATTVAAGWVFIGIGADY
jgi:hypothetical protein